MLITVARQTLPALKASTMRDFMEILNSFDAYDENAHHKSEMTYQLCGNTVEFISLDQPQKLRGRKRDILFLDEANECSPEAFRQLSYRTLGFIVLAYNPSMIDSWVYEVETRDNSALLVTTYRDNPFLPKSIIDEIEALKITSPDDYAVYGMGERGAGKKGRIFRSFQPIDEIPWDECSDISYGLDFGYSNDPLALVKVGVNKQTLYVEELIYETHLDNYDMVERVKGFVDQSVVICDVDKRGIMVLRDGGVKAIAAKKPPGSINAGIQQIQSFHKAYYKRTSQGIAKEIANYSWKLDQNEEATDQPEDKYNHAVDAMRYALSVMHRRQTLFA
jgi:phage terminase large subunit